MRGFLVWHWLAGRVVCPSWLDVFAGLKPSLLSSVSTMLFAEYTFKGHSIQIAQTEEGLWFHPLPFFKALGIKTVETDGHLSEKKAHLLLALYAPEQATEFREWLWREGLIETGTKQDKRLSLDELDRLFIAGQNFGRRLGNTRAGWRIFNEAFGIKAYKDLSPERFEEALAFLELQIERYRKKEWLEEQRQQQEDDE